jgi:hypothetical protein
MDGKFISTAIWVLCCLHYAMSFLQLSQSPMDKRPSYDAIQGANVTPTAFYNIGDLEIQENLARIWYGDHFEFKIRDASFSLYIFFPMMLNLHVLIFILYFWCN